MVIGYFGLQLFIVKKIVLRLWLVNDQQTAPQDNVSLLRIFKENREGLPFEASTCASISGLAGQVS